MPQSLSRVIVHLIYSTKDRAPLLTKDIRLELHAFLAGVLHKEGCTTIQTGGYDDHVHLLFALSRTKTLAEIVAETKTSTSRWLKRRWAACQNFAWQSGYGTISVNPGETSAVEDYIRNQEEHHRRFTFKDEYVALLTEAGIEYDERYMWD